MLDIIFHKKARIEIDEAIDWYEEQKEGLGVDFVIAVDAYVLKIQETPNYYSYRKGNYRGIKMETFPYTIVYQVFPRKQIIHVCSVHHNSRAARHRFRKLG